MLVIRVIFFISIFWGVVNAAPSGSPERQFLENYKQNPQAAYFQIPEKEAGVFWRSSFTWADKKIEQRDQFFQKQTDIRNEGPFRPLAEFEGRDLAEYLIDNPRDHLNNLKSMQEANLLKAKLTKVPWSGHYWPIAKGILGARVFNNDFHEMNDWPERFEFVKNNPANLVEVPGLEELARWLSPSEKYDLLIGSSDLHLTQSMWARGQQIYDEFEGVESWMGICHGWAPAAFMVERPTRSVVVTAADGQTQLKFFPSEIRGLSSFMWAEGNYPARFIGGRCNDKEPEFDEDGRIVKEPCFDSNPGTWHKVVVNQIGVNNRSFVMDATWDYEVWNQPVYSYSYKYFNPNTLDNGDDLEAATIEKEDYENDVFKNYRSEKTKYIVGIQMKVTYIGETWVNDYDHDQSEDNLTNVYYTYDLELDENKKIIGGEWYNRAHPDFLWVPEPGVSPRTYNDYGLDSQTLKFSEPLTRDMQLRAQQNAIYGYILPTLVDALVEQSHENPSENTID